METASVTKVACLAGIAPWKRTRIRQLLGDLNLPIARNAEDAVRIAQQRGGAIAAWATRIPGGLVELAAHVGVPVWRIEDGFIRSAGLGAALHLPASIVLDRSGIYYDPSRPSDLENMLSSHVFSEAECERADALIAALQALRVTKYNLNGTAVELPNHKRVALVIGQVADDASMQLGAVGQSIGDLIERVRIAEPDAYLVYKPHPDVVAGLRKGLIDADADLVVTDADLLTLMDRADTVHVLSSLAGFEALLRGKTVHVHGQPFYAGWGLTTDHNPPPRRGRRLALFELVAGALIAYPQYCHPRTGCVIEVEELVGLLAHELAPRGGFGFARRLLGKTALALGSLRGRE
jgi:capsule polysaccharide export protein KpsC/LpsZ